MIRLSFLSVVNLVSLLSFTTVIGLAHGKPITLIDDWKRSIVVDDQANQRIISLAPHATELVAAAGLLKQLVAVDTNSDYPVSVKSLPKLTSYPRIELEGVISQRPTLIVLWGAGLDRTVIDRLQNYGIAVFVSEPKSAADIVRNLQQFGKLRSLVGEGPFINGEAELAVSQWQQRIKKLELRYASKSQVKYFLQVWQQPLMALSDQSLQGEASRICAGKNVFAQGTSAAPQTDIEAVISLRPNAWLVAASSAVDAVATVKNQTHRDNIKARGFAGHWIILDDAQLQRPGPRWLDGVQAFCAALDSAR